MSTPLSPHDSPDTFTFRQRLILAIAPPIVGFILRIIGATYKIDIRHSDRLERIQEQYGSVFLGVWHETLILAVYAWRDSNYHGLTSYSFDGELAARLLRTMGLEAIRGSSSRGGSAALKHLATSTKEARLVGLALDGPKGPRRIAKPGLAIASLRTGIPVVPVAVASPNVSRLNSWDSTMLPKPFLRIKIAYGNPIDPNDYTGAKRIEQIRVAIEEEMERMYAEVED